MKVSQLLNEWLLSIQPTVKESTYAKYSFLVQKHINSELGDILLSNLTTEDISCFTAGKLNGGNLSDGSALSPKTVADLLSILKLALTFAAERNYPCPNHIIIKKPRQTLPQIQVLSVEEQEKLEQYIFTHFEPAGIGIILSLYTGLRIGEVCALKWGDFNFENNILYIRRTIMRIQDKTHGAAHKTKILIDRPKTECSVRSIPLPAFLVHFLTPYQRKDSYYILTDSEAWLEPRGYYRKYKRILSKCNLSEYNYHALRHTFATRCMEQEFDLKSLSEILGHANVSTTLQRYVHPSMNVKRRQMERLENLAVCGRICGQKKLTNV